MKKMTLIFAVFAILLTLPAVTLAGEGKGTVKVGYVFLDEEGNHSVNHGTFNEYDGPILSLNRFHYGFDNGLMAKMDLNRIALNNRNLNLGLERAGLFGIRLHNDKYRRTYSFNDSHYTRREQTGGSVWFLPHRYVKIMGGITAVDKKGSMLDLFDPVLPTAPQETDYKQMYYHAGLNLRHDGRMFQAMYKQSDFTDNLDSDRDQSRSSVRLDAFLPVPRYEKKLILSGGFRHFETSYDKTDFSLSSNTVWGGAKVNLPENFAIKYGFYFDRTSSDSDFVATDNLVHSAYLSHLWPAKAGVTVGYQYDINDDYSDEVQSNSLYFSGWAHPDPRVEIRGEYGTRAEEVQSGSRLVGDADRSHYRFTVTYREKAINSLKAYFEGRNRENDQIGTKADFTRVGVALDVEVPYYGNLIAGYSLSNGEFTNTTDKFEFRDHFVNADFYFREFYKTTVGVGGTYYRSKRDLDVESFMMRFTGSYRLADDYRIEAEYNVHNFDDFLVRDQYYTANIVKVTLTKDISIN